MKLADIRGDLQMHTTASDGKNSIEERGRRRGIWYDTIALTDHPKAVTVANGWATSERLNQIKKIRAARIVCRESPPGRHRGGYPKERIARSSIVGARQLDV